MENGKLSAYPTVEVDEHGDIFAIGGGLTKREYFAGLAMQGILANQTFSREKTDAIAIVAVNASDELLKQLDK